MQFSKNIKIFINYFLGPLLFVWLSVTIYQHINNQPQLEASWLRIKSSFQSVQVLLLVFALLLVPANWGFEAYKWKLSVASIYPVSFKMAFKAILTGVSFSVTTPNRVGEYFGRMMYLPEGNRLKSVSVTFVGSVSQLLVTVVTGTIAFILLQPAILQAGYITPSLYAIALASFIFVSLILTLLYFGIGGISKLLIKWFKKSQYLYLIDSLKAFGMQLLLKVLLFSFLRYLVFVIQYFLLFHFFVVYVPVLQLWSVLSLLFLSMAIIPTITMIEVGLRGEISLKLVGMFTANSLGIGLTSVTIWFINLVMPAIVGSILILSIKVFKRKNETT